jgi:hypothetical protein
MTPAAYPTLAVLGAAIAGLAFLAASGVGTPLTHIAAHVASVAFGFVLGAEWALSLVRRTRRNDENG